MLTFESASVLGVNAIVEKLTVRLPHCDTSFLNYV